MPAASALNPGVALGIDLGTSGVRAAVVEKKTNGGVSVLEEASAAWSDAEGRRPEVWLSKLRETLSGCAQLSKVERVAVSGKVHTGYILLWNFSDPIHPQVVLEAPGDVGATIVEWSTYRQHVEPSAGRGMPLPVAVRRRPAPCE